MSGKLLCPSCHADPEKQPDCETCFGSGAPRSVPYCDDPWNEVVPGLWVGGHDYDDFLPKETPTYMLEEAGFDVVISFYSRPGCHPPVGVEHHYYRISDGRLDRNSINDVWALANLAVDRLKRGKKVLVRCQAGLNRSNLCVGYALIALGWPSGEAIAHLRKVRSPYSLCNSDFVDYLQGDYSRVVA